MSLCEGQMGRDACRHLKPTKHTTNEHNEVDLSFGFSTMIYELFNSGNVSSCP